MSRQSVGKQKRRVIDMTLVDEIRGFETGLVRRMRASLDHARILAGKRRVYARTLNELNSLSARDLDDLGIHTADIPAIAKEAAGL